MACNICDRFFNESHRKPLCASCARANLYEPRHQQASALLKRERFHAQTEAVVRPYNDGLLAALPVDVDLDVLGESSKKYNSEWRKAQLSTIDERIRLINVNAEELKRQIAECREYIAERRTALDQRRKELKTEQKEAEKHKSRLTEPIHLATRKTIPRLERVRIKVTDARHLLCREAALACNFQKRKAWNGRSEYSIGNIAIPNLRELNIRTQASQNAVPTGGRTIAEPHDLISEAFDNVARLTNLCAHYLQVRLPAEIVLPHADFPRSVIMSERSSYREPIITFPGFLPSQSTSPVASRMLDRNRPHPRPLYIDRPLAELAKDDPKSYGLFVEGIALLAWDLAWLCKTQGVDHVNTFEDFCAIGRNMWQLLNTLPRKQRQDSHRDRRTPSKDEHSKTSDLSPSLGVYSHNSTKHNLASAVGLDLLKDWKLASSARLTDKLKAFLLNEMSGAEWDVIEEKEWDDEREDEQPVLVGGLRRPQESRHVAMSVISVKPSDGDEEKGQGNNGWMKLRGRGGQDV